MKQTLISIHGEKHRVDLSLKEVQAVLASDYLGTWIAKTSSGDTLIVRPKFIDVIELKEVGE